MAQDPAKPRDSGRISLPSLDAGMNKTRPIDRIGGKGSNDAADDSMAGRAGKKAIAADFLAKVRKRFDLIVKAEAENRGEMLADKKMKAGDQWPADVKAERNRKQRPCLTVNKLPTFVHQVTNDLRQNRPAVNFSPVGERGDLEVAKIYAGLFRHDWRTSKGDIALDTAVNDAATSGLGYIRMLTEWRPGKMKQVIRFKRVRNVFSVYLGPHQEPDGSDVPYAFVSELVAKDTFKEDWPDADPISFTLSGDGDYKGWISGDEIRVAEYWEIEHEKRTLVQLDNGHVGYEDELAPEAVARIAAGTLTVLKEREDDVPHVKWYKLTATEILDQGEWLGRWIPIAKCIGDEDDVAGKVQYAGVVRHARDAQKMYNYWVTSETETVALAPKAPFVMEEGQIEGHEDEWKTANTDNSPVLTYKGTNINGVLAPPPQRQPPPQIPAAIVAAKQGAAADMMATTGIRFDASPQERTYDESGRALRELRRNSDIGAFHFADNACRTLEHIGNMYVDLVTQIYDTPQMLTILREDDKEEAVKVDPNLDKPMAETKHPVTGKTLKIFNLTYGEYGVVVTTGPSYATRRIEASQSMMDFARALPASAALIMDLIAKNQDWPGADEMATRLAKAIPPQYLTPDQKDVPPQVQALMQAMGAQIKQLTAERQQMLAALGEKKTEQDIERSKIANDFEAKLLKIVADVETKQAQTQAGIMENLNTHVVAQVRELGSGVKLLHDMMMAQQAANKPKEVAEAA